jgi:hypothetical protein
MLYTSCTSTRRNERPYRAVSLGLHRMLEALNAQTGWDVPIHVDAASGGFIAPFINPDLVRSIAAIDLVPHAQAVQEKRQNDMPAWPWSARGNRHVI